MARFDSATPLSGFGSLFGGFPVAVALWATWICAAISPERPTRTLLQEIASLPLTPPVFAILLPSMNGKRILFLGLFCLGLAVSAAQGSLAWEKTTIELNPVLGAPNAVGVFKYENKGDTPVHFKGAPRTSCGCTVAALQKTQVAPGEKGEITATFNIGDRTGVQMKTITVETDDPQNPTTVLTLKANIAQLLELQPAFVFWQAGEEAKPKTILAKAGKGVTLKNVEVTSSSGDFTAKVEPGAAGQFKINVQPKDTAKPLNATLTVKPDAGSGPAKVYYAAARVMPPGTAKP